MAPASPPVQKLQPVAHRLSVQARTKPQYPPHHLTDWKPLLLGHDDARVVATRPHELAVKPTEIGGVIRQQDAALSCRTSQLPFIADFSQARLTGRRHLPAAIASSTNQRVGLRVFIQVEAKLAHTAAVCAGALANTSRSSAR